MKLIDYMAENGLAPEAMADKIGGCSASGVIKWMRGDRLPRIEQQRRIYEVTGGVVAPNDFVLKAEQKQPESAS